MKKIKLFYFIALWVLTLLSFTSCSILNVENTDKELATFSLNSTSFKHSNGIKDYGYYDIGVCRKLVGEVYCLVIFIDDDESSWTKSSRNTFYNSSFYPSINYLTKQAQKRNINLNLSCGQYTTKSDLLSPIRYNGIIQPSSEKALDNMDIMAQTAQNLGFPNKEVMHAFLKNSTGAKQIAYILCLNKSGRPYSVSDSTYDDKDSIEFVVAFSDNEYGLTNVGSSILHEFLHLFGAADLYDASGEYREREKLCKKLFPKDVMMKNAIDPNSLDIGILTECLIGWSDQFPSACDCPEWWEKTSNKEHRPPYSSVN